MTLWLLIGAAGGSETIELAGFVIVFTMMIAMRFGY